jgi:pyruvate,water dikinase
VSEQYIAWLDQTGEDAPFLLGRKGSNLAAMNRAGFSVPAGFCITAQAFRAFLAANALTELGDERQLAARISKGDVPEDLRKAITDACHSLAADAVAVRSSAISEDLPTASFAGQQETYLNVQGDKALLDAVRLCWASLYSERAIAYRHDRGIQDTDKGMAVVIQAMIPCEVAGVAFCRDPLLGADKGVIEFAPGFGSDASSGSAEIERSTFNRTGDRAVTPHSASLIRTDQIQRVADTAMELERLFGQPQDVEWGYYRDKLYLFQSRPITAPPTGFFTEVLPNDEIDWTSGFLNERFPQVLSPLGWTLIRDLIEPLGFRDPLRFMGFKPPAGMPLLKLYRGHPFVNVRVFQILFKPFPRSLLPEDVERYFPGGNAELRKNSSYPRCLLDPRFVISMLWFFAKDPANWSPLHNFRHWKNFIKEFDRKMALLYGKTAALNDKGDPGAAWEIIEEAQDLGARLLAIHRWSLIWAEIFYSLLRRLSAAWMWEGRANEMSARLVSGLPNKSLELNKALEGLAHESDWSSFMDNYGHRSYSLDIYHPSFMENSDRLRQLADRAAGDIDLQGRSAQRKNAETAARRALRSRPWGRLKLHFFNLALSGAQRYMPLREDQRFYWQKILALERRLSLWIGKYMTGKGLLGRPEDIFFITMDELRQAVAGGGIPAREISGRRKDFGRLQQSFQTAPELSYPSFLHGNQPVESEHPYGTDVLRGQPVSPGLAQGPARLVAVPDQFSEILPGDILVTHGADPGWTVLFGRIAGLVMEAGGQLSHAAVVAREYGLPAVAGVAGAMRQIQNGEEILVDGLSGTVTRVEKSSSGDHPA